MSDRDGSYLNASNDLFRPAGTLYQLDFLNVGMDPDNPYVDNGGDFLSPGPFQFGNSLTVRMVIHTPGDWIRVLTQPIPESGNSGLAVGILAALSGWTVWLHRHHSHRG